MKPAKGLTKPKPMGVKPKVVAPKKKFNEFGVEITAADEARMKADDARYKAGRAQAAAAPPPKYSQADVEKARLAKRRQADDAALNAASKKGLKGRRAGIDRMLGKS
jgi:hypothetical protein